MSSITVDGVYENGKVTLLSLPDGVEKARVKVTFLTDSEDLAKAEKERKRLEAGERLLALMKEGIDFGGVKFNREEIYEERMQELERRRERH